MHNPVAQLLASEGNLSIAALPLARSAVLDQRIDPAIRSSLLGAIGQMSGPMALDGQTKVFAWMNPAPSTPPAAGAPADAVEAAWRRFVGDRRRATELDYFINVARTADPAQRTLAFAVLIQSIRTPRTPAPIREKVAPAIEAAWSDPASAPSLAQAIGLMRLESQYTEKLAAYNQSKSR
jgi:hypothetical protein